MPKLWSQLSKIENYPEYLDGMWNKHLQEKDKDAPTVISTFAGCGGSSLGYSMAGFRELLAVEWNDNAVETFRLNFPDIPVYHGDIKKLLVEKCLKLSGLQLGELDILDGSPPCQGFSTAGKREFGDVRNQLAFEFIRLLRGLKPKVFVMENVSGMVKGKMKLLFAEIMRELKASGYNVKARLLNAKWFGVPQSRERLIFIGVREDLDKAISYPKAKINIITAGETIKDIKPKDIKRLTKSSRKTLAAWESIGPGESMPNFHARKRLDPQKPSNTQGKARPHFHWTEPREMTWNECAILQSFPTKFRFTGSAYNKIARIGNSVPPLMMYHIAKHIRKNILTGQEPELIE